MVGHQMPFFNPTHLPLTNFGCYCFTHSGLASPIVAVAAFIVGRSFPFVSTLPHKVPSKGQEGLGSPSWCWHTQPLGVPWVDAALE